MRVDARTPAVALEVRDARASGPARARPAVTVAAERTPASMGELRAALGRSYEKLTGKPASAGLLDVLSAQVSLETGGGDKMYNWNFGGIKGASPQGMTASYMTREVTAQGEVHLKQGFRAYASIDDGATDYLRVIHGRFGAAIPHAERGDVDGFAQALKESGYYTAPESEYASALRSRMGASGASGASPAAMMAPGTRLQAPALNGSILPMSVALGASNPASSYATSDELARVMDALSLSAAQIAAPSSEDPER